MIQISALPFSSQLCKDKIRDVTCWGSARFQDIMCPRPWSSQDHYGSSPAQMGSNERRKMRKWDGKWDTDDTFSMILVEGCGKWWESHPAACFRHVFIRWSLLRPWSQCSSRRPKWSTGLFFWSKLDPFFGSKSTELTELMGSLATWHGQPRAGSS